MTLAEFAPAKVNLFLHVGPLRPDGYHPLASLMVFADIGDRLTAEPWEGFALAVDGPFAGHAPAGDDNLVARAAAALFARIGAPAPALRLTLTKALPAGAGLGGGSADAAAVLRLLRGAMMLPAADADLLEICASLGSDVPACLASAPVIAEGRGEVLSPAPTLPELPAVLVRPDAASPTGPVYRTFDAMGQGPPASLPDMPRAFADIAALVGFLTSTRNDLEPPAAALEPRIAEALAALRAAPESLFTRMSGSGSACFALCADMATAEQLAGTLSAARPDWWVQSCRLGGPWG